MIQHTVREIIEFSGIGLHTGVPAGVRVLPAPDDTGIVFVRTDLSGAPRIKARSRNVVSTRFATTLGTGGVTVGTVEHLMAAFYGLGVDNAIVEVDGPEVPIMDGSAEPFVDMITASGLRMLDAPRRYLVVKRPIRVSDGDGYVHLLPPAGDGREGLTIDFTIDFAHPRLSKQSFTFDLSPRTFATEVVGARTFGFLSDVERLRQNGLARGGSLDNAVVIGENDILNEGGLRFGDEFVRHKVLDLIGDLSLVGMPVVGRLEALRAGHAMNHELVKKVCKHTGRWKVEQFGAPGLVIPARGFTEKLAIA